MMGEINNEIVDEILTYFCETDWDDNQHRKFLSNLLGRVYEMGYEDGINEEDV